MLFWDGSERKSPGHLFHERKKNYQHIPKKIQALLSPNHTDKTKVLSKQEQVKSVKPQQDQWGEFCPTCGISSAKHKNPKSDTGRKLHFHTGRSKDFPAAQARESDVPSSDSTSGRMAHLSPKVTSCPQDSWTNPSLKGSNTDKLFWGGPRAPGPGGTLLCWPHRDTARSPVQGVPAAPTCGVSAAVGTFKHPNPSGWTPQKWLYHTSDCGDLTGPANPWGDSNAPVPVGWASLGGDSNPLEWHWCPSPYRITLWGDGEVPAPVGWAFLWDDRNPIGRQQPSKGDSNAPAPLAWAALWDDNPTGWHQPSGVTSMHQPLWSEQP